MCSRASWLTAHLRGRSRATPAVGPTVRPRYAVEKWVRAGARQVATSAGCVAGPSAPSGRPGAPNGQRWPGVRSSCRSSGVCRRTIVREVWRGTRPGCGQRDDHGDGERDGDRPGRRLGQQRSRPAADRPAQHGDDHRAGGEEATRESPAAAPTVLRPRHQTRAPAAGRRSSRRPRTRAPPWREAEGSTNRAAAYGTSMASTVATRKPAPPGVLAGEAAQPAAEEVLASTPATDMVSPEAVDRNAAKAPRRGWPRAAPRAGRGPRGRAAPARSSPTAALGQVWQVHPPEHAVDRGKR